MQNKFDKEIIIHAFVVTIFTKFRELFRYLGKEVFSSNFNMSTICIRKWLETLLDCVFYIDYICCDRNVSLPLMNYAFLFMFSCNTRLIIPK